MNQRIKINHVIKAHNYDEKKMIINSYKSNAVVYTVIVNEIK